MWSLHLSSETPPLCLLTIQQQTFVGKTPTVVVSANRSQHAMHPRVLRKVEHFVIQNAKRQLQVTTELVPFAGSIVLTAGSMKVLFVARRAALKLSLRRVMDEELDTP